MYKLVSILIPSRGRFDELLKAIQSIISTTKKLQDIEIIIRFDDDDDSSLNRLGELPTAKVDINTMIGTRHGYIALHKYVNEMCAEAKGRFLFMFDDDCIISTKNWDNIVRKHLGEIVCLNPNQDGTGKGANLFPIISREIYEITGHFSLSTHVDSWQQLVSRYADIEIKVPEFIIMHNRKQEYVSDTNRRDILDYTQNMWSTLNKARINDADKIKKFMAKRKKDGYGNS